MNLNDAATLGGLLFGSVGLTLGVLNYLRDRIKVDVLLQWEMATWGTAAAFGAQCGLVTITNTGKRPVFLSHVALTVPKGHEASHLLLGETIQGQRLDEGAAPLIYPVKYSDDLKVYANDWKKVRAQVSDSTGKVWKSPRFKRLNKPSWAAQ